MSGYAYDKKASMTGGERLVFTIFTLGFALWTIFSDVGFTQADVVMGACRCPAFGGKGEDKADPPSARTSLMITVLTSISAVDGDRCPLVPTCSQYAVEAIEMHGLFIGWIMTCARIIQELDEPYHAEPVMKDGEIRFHDPVTANDYWWFNVETTLTKGP